MMHKTLRCFAIRPKHKILLGTNSNNPVATQKSPGNRVNEPNMPAKVIVLIHNFEWKTRVCDNKISQTTKDTVRKEKHCEHQPHLTSTLYLSQRNQLSQKPKQSSVSPKTTEGNPLNVTIKQIST